MDFPDLEKALAAIGGCECSSDTDELSVEKLQEHLLPYKKETVQKIIDEKMQLVTADEFLKLHKESLTAIRENDKLQEQLNTAKKALTEISSTRKLLKGATMSEEIQGWRDIIQQNGKINQPQLTIPKSIADLLDKFIEFYFDDVGHEDWWIQENGLIEWFSKTPNCYIKDAYLAGKALGVDLVKVVEK